MKAVAREHSTIADGDGEKVSSLEGASLVLGGTATGFQLASQTASALAGLLQLIPDFDAGIMGILPVIKAIFGGKNLGPAARVAGDVLGMAASTAQYGAGLTSTLAGDENLRRRER